MKVYLYNPENGEFTREDNAIESPAEEGVYLIPAFATTVAPPSVQEGEIAAFSGKGWTVRKKQTSPPRTPATARAAKLAEIKGTASAMLSAEDYIVQRHAEQRALGIPTSISTEEYTALLVKRQAIRDRSNQYEASLAGTPDIAAIIDALKISY